MPQSYHNRATVCHNHSTIMPQSYRHISGIHEMTPGSVLSEICESLLVMSYG